MMLRDVLWILLGYLSGSVLFARLWGSVLGRDVTARAEDRNPGAANAFIQGGFFMGVMTLVGDVLKGAIPVALYVQGLQEMPGLIPMALVLAAPVCGHVWPCWYGFRGGKGIAATFGCLLGLLPLTPRPFAILACCFIGLSCVVRVSPNYHRTLIAYAAALVLMAVRGVFPGVALGFLLMTGMMAYRMHVSPEARPQCRFSLPWLPGTLRKRSS